MQRRDLLRLLAGVPILAGTSPDELLALARTTHDRLGAGLGFFDDHQMRTVAAAGDRIIPATDTPGAMAASCHRFTERIVAEHYDAERQARFLAGIVDLDRRARETGMQLFVDLDAAAQDRVLAAVESAAYLANADGADSFWRDLKHLTLYGYYTSEIGMRQEQQVPLVPGRFDGCLPIAEAP